MSDPEVKVLHTMGNESLKIDNEPLIEGQLLYDNEAKRILLDTVVNGTLTRIVMKEGIFVGKLSEWQSLSDAQKSVFTFVNITDDYESASDVFVGATASTEGVAGLVPCPLPGDQGKVLYGDGTWKSVATFYSQMLTAGSTSVTFDNIPEGTNYYAIFTSKIGLNYNSMTASRNSIAVSFDAQSTDITVYLRIERVI